MYFGLEEALNLKRAFAANPNTVVMQVYAAGLVGNAMRMTQGEVAETVGVRPEEISLARFYSKLAAPCHSSVATQATVQDTRARLGLPDWRPALGERRAQNHSRRAAPQPSATPLFSPRGATGRSSRLSAEAESSSRYLSGDGTNAIGGAPPIPTPPVRPGDVWDDIDGSAFSP